MKLSEIDKYYRGLMQIDELVRTDVSMNGIQVSAGNGNADECEIGKIAFAVDACMESFERAADQAADMLFVHHGLFWGKPEQVSGAHFRRLKFLIEHNISLYAAHLPLDIHPEFGNNAGMCESLGITDPEPFGEYHGFKIGFKGRLPEACSISHILDKLGLSADRALSVLPFGPEEIRTVALVSGGGQNEVYQAMDEDVDLYITGDSSHQIYHPCLENRINLISGGHYHTETWGVRLLSEKTAADLNIETVFIDVPTGL
ncbi:MAG: Nif3-like dinuclear metal center hexameric protein [Spirochaetales bacterium]|uniref:Nif3-like dinuclear metal center hexameric protein n=1 Tax=Candidatus Thalassospirochaeta sargassi TaxID=3119039 RepID=A0AAJ1IC00_9SPIO|nr:Nif3-like dinuclear metal center hexameric protein [Spirochaetales bacterium]